MAPHHSAATIAAGTPALDFRPYILLIMINTALILTLILSIVACCDCCMEDDDRDYSKKRRKSRRRTFRHGGDRPSSLPGGMVGRREYGTLALIDAKMQASTGAKKSAVAAKAPAKPTGHYIDVGALPPPITIKTEKVAPNLHETKEPPAKEKFAKPGAYGTMMGIENAMKASKGKTGGG